MSEPIQFQDPDTGHPMILELDESDQPVVHLADAPDYEDADALVEQASESAIEMNNVLDNVDALDIGAATRALVTWCGVSL